MPNQSVGNSDTLGPSYNIYSTCIGPDCDTLIIAQDKDWMESPEEKLYLACEHGHVDLDEMR